MAKLITIPANLIPEIEAWGQLTSQLFGKIRTEAGLAPKNTPKSQMWYWTKRWQQWEREADDAEATGDYVAFDNMDDALHWLDE